MAWTQEERDQQKQEAIAEQKRWEEKRKAEKAREWATIPPEVLEVHNALNENARKVYPDPEDFKAFRLVYTYPESYWEGCDQKYTGSWITGSNREDGRPVMVWKDGAWFYESTNGADYGSRPMEGGHAEALANAEIFWTG